MSEARRPQRSIGALGAEWDRRLVALKMASLALEEGGSRASLDRLYRLTVQYGRRHDVTREEARGAVLAIRRYLAGLTIW